MKKRLALLSALLMLLTACSFGDSISQSSAGEMSSASEDHEELTSVVTSVPDDAVLSDFDRMLKDISNFDITAAECAPEKTAAQFSGDYYNSSPVWSGCNGDEGNVTFAFVYGDYLLEVFYIRYGEPGSSDPDSYYSWDFNVYNSEDYYYDDTEDETSHSYNSVHIRCTMNGEDYPRYNENEDKSLTKEKIDKKLKL